MRKIILMMPVSADVFIEGPERELNWHKVDHESDQDQVRRVFGPAGAGLRTLVRTRAARVCWRPVISAVGEPYRRGPAVPAPQRAARP
jgi:hypothetical protein